MSVMKLIILFFLLLSFDCLAQRDTVIFTGINGRLVSGENASLKREVDFRPGGRIVVTTYSKTDGNWIRQYRERIRKVSTNEYRINGKRDGFAARFIRKYKEAPDGLYNFSEFIDNRLVKRGVSKTLIPLILHGEVTEYSHTGQVRSRSIFHNNELISNENWLESGEKYINNIFYSVDQEPLFSKGMGEMHSHVRKLFIDSGLDFNTLNGSLIIGFVVMEDGAVEGIRVLKGITPGVNTIAVNAIETLEGNWTPARLNGNAVRYFQVFPINFIHREYRFDSVEFTGSMLHWEKF